MLNRYARGTFTRVFSPLARLLLRLGVHQDVVSAVGTLGVVVGALWFYPRGELWWGTLFITAFVFSDLVDGTMARISGRSSPWGAYLDSTLDRVGDAAIFGGLVLWFLGDGDRPLDGALALGCLAGGFLVSYAKARAESFGWVCEGGIAERADRLVAVLVATGFTGLFLPDWVLTTVLALLLAASLVTVVQRMAMVRRQAVAG
ncbi:CDP-alcohol phosphatidyltransferase family protein [Ornithinimicrobium humiphilum]|uniref:Phosphatidylinositol phosphate synthase n=1 Tax=Ornithinimicrobium humiphilum TaxID=125288 RepID=A0A543KNT7_9MICO|nr:CDP-alcohol phosphatidyltransferase family protein [Ornithinimicrobium humiphilum]TQM96722.1 CDP-diacylglycerol--glycerol-3-phosphate 3-phosphatidyltransferase [Ornithinimicrobium humiphilum]